MKAFLGIRERENMYVRRQRCEMLHVSTQEQSSSFIHASGFLTKHLKKFIFGSVQLPHESLSCASSLQLTYAPSEEC